MKTYITTTGIIFALITVAHLWRMIEEGKRLMTEPGYAVLTLVSATLAVWAWRLLVRPRS